MLEKVLDYITKYCFGVMDGLAIVIDRASEYVPDWAILLGFALSLAGIKLILPLWVFKAVFVFVVAPVFAGTVILIATAWALSRKG